MYGNYLPLMHTVRSLRRRNACEFSRFLPVSSFSVFFNNWRFEQCVLCTWSKYIQNVLLFLPINLLSSSNTQSLSLYQRKNQLFKLDCQWIVFFPPRIFLCLYKPVWILMLHCFSLKPTTKHPHIWNWCSVATVTRQRPQPQRSTSTLPSRKKWAQV